MVGTATVARGPLVLGPPPGTVAVAVGADGGSSAPFNTTVGKWACWLGASVTSTVWRPGVPGG